LFIVSGILKVLHKVSRKTPSFIPINEKDLGKIRKNFLDINPTTPYISLKWWDKVGKSGIRIAG
jgi:hypothetical protein